jgi:hypothetical protein
MEAILAIAALLAPAAPAPLPPRDECQKDAGFAAYRASLASAVRAKDAKRLLALTSDDIDFSFGGDSGKVEFARSWRLDRPRESKLWQELETVLRLGCAFNEGQAEAPWLYARFPRGLDPFDHAVVVRPGATAHVTPNAGGQVLAKLSWDILPIVSDLGGAWTEVRLPDGRPAFVRGSDLRSPIDYRAGFERRNGRWLMTMFIAGD